VASCQQSWTTLAVPQTPRSLKPSEDIDPRRANAAVVNQTQILRNARVLLRLPVPNILKNWDEAASIASVNRKPTRQTNRCDRCAELRPLFMAFAIFARMASSSLPSLGSKDASGIRASWSLGANDSIIGLAILSIIFAILALVIIADGGVVLSSLGIILAVATFNW